MVPDRTTRRLPFRRGGSVVAMTSPEMPARRPVRLPGALCLALLLGCHAQTPSSAAPPGQDLVRLYVRSLSDGTQIYQQSLSPTPPPGYASTSGRPELAGGTFYASAGPRPGMVPVYAFTIASTDGTPVVFLSTNAQPPPSFTGPEVRFYAFPAAGSSTVPVYLYTILDGHGTQVYYYSTSATTPPSFRAAGAVFHVFNRVPEPVQVAAASEPADTLSQVCHPTFRPCAEGLRCCDMGNLGGINDPQRHPPRYECLGGSSCPAALP